MKTLRNTFLILIAALLLAPASWAGAYADYKNKGNVLVKKKQYNLAVDQYNKALAVKDNAALKAYVKKMNAAGYMGSPAPAKKSASKGKGNVAIVVSTYTKEWLDGKGKNPENVDVAVSGAVKALKKLGYSFKKITDKDVEAGKLVSGGYDMAILPDSTAMSVKEMKALKKFQDSGKGILAVWGYGGFDEDGLDQMNLEVMNSVFGVTFTGWQGDPNVGMGPFDQYFWFIKNDKTHPVGSSLPDKMMCVTGEGNTVSLDGAKEIYSFTNRDKATKIGGSAVSAYDPGSGKGKAVFIGTYMCSQIAGDDPDIPKALQIRLFGSILKWLQS